MYCPWCAGDPDESFDPDTDADGSRALCRTHEAEYEGMSLDQLDRRDGDAEQYVEEADAMGWQTAHNRWR